MFNAKLQLSLPFRCGRFRLANGQCTLFSSKELDYHRAKRPAAKQMHVKVRHFLPAVIVAIHY
ncbi:hypothetical protein A359_08200 [secondary endosymbiont of Ctenarytaina eucalypti]|uniref:Uncharacterized protein n=1 Tax=secondary endosymbiont of Ctenarytaina eucalypti TaxID=1199245 RepID=J3VTA0_9ENTR|nr:hypothetical protein A359_08200 [secondary endosymbiont of Ctenarytaina eucalypti]